MQNGITADYSLPYTATAFSLNVDSINNVDKKDDRKILLEAFAKEWFKYNKRENEIEEGP